MYTATTTFAYTIVLAVCLSGLYGAARIYRRNGRLGMWLFTIWAVACVPAIEGASHLLYRFGACDGLSCLRYVVLLTSTLGASVFVRFGLVNAWPRAKDKLGYPWRGKAILLLLIGALVGTLMSGMPGLLFGTSYDLDFSRGLPWHGLAMLVWMWFPVAILEESVFRGRLFSTLRRRLGNPIAVLAIQDVAFLVPHIFRLAGVTARWGIAHGMDSAISVAVMGLVYGLMRMWSGSLWMPSGAHTAYNCLIILGSLDFAY